MRPLHDAARRAGLGPRHLLALRAPLRLFALSTLVAAGTAWAGASTDGSMGAVQTLSGAFSVPQSLGTLRGSNLFHSFSRFSITASESATFNTTEAGLRNVIVRVTGGEASLLQGPLILSAANGARPDFFLVNPSGITLSAGARFDVPAGLHLSTASSLRFADGTSWATNGTAPSTLSVAAPESFGFLGARAAAALQLSDATLAAGAGQPLTLSGGSLNLQRTTLQASDATVRLSAVGADAASVPVASGTTQGLAAGGSLQLSESSLNLQGSGRIELQGGALQLSGNSSLFANGRGNGIRLSGSSIALDSALVQLVATQDGGDPGLIEVSTPGALTLRNAAEISALSFQAANRAQALLISSGSLQLSDSLIGSTGLGARDAGGLSVSASGAMLIEGASSRIFSATGGSGPAGTVSVRAGSLRINGVSGIEPDQVFYAAPGITSQSENGATGQSGAIDLRVNGALEMSRQAVISASAPGQGNAGSVSVQAASLLLDGGGLPGLKGIFSNTNGSIADAGRVEVRISGEAVIRAGAAVAAESSQGRSGSVLLSAGSLWVDGQGAGSERSGVFARALPDSPGRVGTVDVQVAGELRLSQGAALSIANESTRVPAQPVPASLLQVQAARLNLEDAEISASSVGSIAASAVRVSALESMSLLRSSIRTTAVDGDGGPITVGGGGRLTLRDARISTSVLGERNGNGGDIAVSAPALILASSAIQANTRAPLARGGTVSLAVGTLLPDGSHVLIGGNRISDLVRGLPGANVIQAAAPDGVGGTLAVTLPQLELSGQLAGVNASWIDFGTLVPDACLRDLRSTLSIAARGKLAPLAGGPLRFE